MLEKKELKHEDHSAQGKRTIALDSGVAADFDRGPRMPFLTDHDWRDIRV